MLLLGLLLGCFLSSAHTLKNDLHETASKSYGSVVGDLMKISDVGNATDSSKTNWLSATHMSSYEPLDHDNYFLNDQESYGQKSRKIPSELALNLLDTFSHSSISVDAKDHNKTQENHLGALDENTLIRTLLATKKILSKLGSHRKCNPRRDFELRQLFAGIINHFYLGENSYNLNFKPNSPWGSQSHPIEKIPKGDKNCESQFDSHKNEDLVVSFNKFDTNVKKFIGMKLSHLNGYLSKSRKEIEELFPPLLAYLCQSLFNVRKNYVQLCINDISFVTSFLIDTHHDNNTHDSSVQREKRDAYASEHVHSSLYPESFRQNYQVTYGPGFNDMHAEPSNAVFADSRSGLVSPPQYIIIEDDEPAGDIKKSMPNKIYKLLGVLALGTYGILGLLAYILASGFANSQNGLGIVGPPGPPGNDGPAGDRGMDGRDGEDGANGEKGDTGAKGERGVKGMKGMKGAHGPAGAKGAHGMKGVKGLGGVKGDKGNRGHDGPRGHKGDKGMKGPKGMKGMKGNKGKGGSNGPDGRKGEAGFFGEKGETYCCMLFRGLVPHRDPRQDDFMEQCSNADHLPQCFGGITHPRRRRRRGVLQSSMENLIDPPQIHHLLYEGNGEDYSEVTAEEVVSAVNSLHQESEKTSGCIKCELFKYLKSRPVVTVDSYIIAGYAYLLGEQESFELLADARVGREHGFDMECRRREDTCQVTFLDNNYRDVVFN